MFIDGDAICKLYEPYSLFTQLIIGSSLGGQEVWERSDLLQQHDICQRNCRRNIQEGPCLPPSCSKEASIAVLNLWLLLQ